MSIIYHTTDYNQFKLFDENRDIKNVDFLISSIKKNNLLQYNPIQVNSEYYVIDGQHRLEACKQMNIPVYYIINENGTAMDIPLLNSNMRTWSSEQFTEFYSKKGYEQYTFIKKIKEKYKLQYYFVIENCCNRSAMNEFRSRDTLVNLYKDGKLKLSKLPEELEDDFEKLSSILELCKNNLDVKSFTIMFYRAVLNLIRLPDYDHDYMIGKMLTRMSEMRKAINEVYVGNIERVIIDNVYNYRKSINRLQNKKNVS